MNWLALGKALGIYLLILMGVAAWIGGTVWANLSGREDLVPLVAGAPLLIAAGLLIFFFLIVGPIGIMYDHFKGESR